MTGWRWINPNAKKPYKEFCYIHNIDKVRIDLAFKENDITTSGYDYYTANKYNLNQNQWNNLEKNIIILNNFVSIFTDRKIASVFIANFPFLFH